MSIGCCARPQDNLQVLIELRWQLCSALVRRGRPPARHAHAPQHGAQTTTMLMTISRYTADRRVCCVWVCVTLPTSRARRQEGGAQLLTLSNGLLERSFSTSPAFGTTELRNERTGQSALRQLLPGPCPL